MAVRIAVIDSGINPWHSHVQGVEGGVSLRLGRGGRISESGDFQDALGHGTAIAGIIREQAPAGLLQAIRIFHNALEAPAAVLLAALERAIALNAKIIHLSLGTEREDVRPKLERLCREACDRRIVVVAAGRAPDDRVCPAALDTVIGVYWNRDCGEDSLIYHPGKPVEFGAYGLPRELPGVPREANFRGNSFAAARVTARVAGWLERHPRTGWRGAREMLREQARGG
jgi:hypothetical protein